jgi:Domain of unknown function (DUF932)
MEAEQMMNLHNFTNGAAANRGPINMASRILSDESLLRMVPSAFATEAHGSRSDRYAFVPTSAVIAALRKEGFEPVDATQSAARTLEKIGFTKHMIKFARPSAALAKVGDTVPQVCLVNSHDGSSVYELMSGLYRLACSNGLIVSDGQFESVSIRHTGNVVGEVIEGSFRVIENAMKAGEVAAEWKAIAFATAAMALRFGGEKQPFYPERLLNVKREEDRGQDLWTAFNRVQENLLGGGQRGRNANGRRQTVRAIKGIDGNVGLNKALWTLTEQMAKLKQAA